MKNKEIIKKITLQVGDKEIDLTVDEARALFEGLRQLFGATEVTITPTPWVSPYWPPTYPTITYGGTAGAIPPDTITITCDSAAASPLALGQVGNRLTGY